ncbi:hypothetical protein IMG5_021540 [Ichthyophthirius multifiliis]|uniref:Transmembrane protein n=1 Tax=Ichthyophthirius multifiliis TaxID=5932 RepID=G0QKT0_ICHMU|nr:hypothetical protein IMG5_021540 [Ichthyophthirius multifiliis]EGR34173.1 hypothetical protein IMG5_021540 [Ichthyophthirius multifiliis]|eukprot:XP_004039477.1 hypothetical protein IMG5_021540 [Ichthyophthirius multifiliis]
MIYFNYTIFIILLQNRELRFNIFFILLLFITKAFKSYFFWNIFFLNNIQNKFSNTCSSNNSSFFITLINTTISNFRINSTISQKTSRSNNNIIKSTFSNQIFSLNFMSECISCQRINQISKKVKRTSNQARTNKDIIINFMFFTQTNKQFINCYFNKFTIILTFQINSNCIYYTNYFFSFSIWIKCHIKYTIYFLFLFQFFLLNFRLVEQITFQNTFCLYQLIFKYLLSCFLISHYQSYSIA